MIEKTIKSGYSLPKWYSNGLTGKITRNTCHWIYSHVHTYYSRILTFLTAPFPHTVII